MRDAEVFCNWEHAFAASLERGRLILAVVGYEVRDVFPSGEAQLLHHGNVKIVEDWTLLECSGLPSRVGEVLVCEQMVFD